MPVNRARRAAVLVLVAAFVAVAGGVYIGPPVGASEYAPAPGHTPKPHPHKTETPSPTPTPTPTRTPSPTPTPTQTSEPSPDASQSPQPSVDGPDTDAGASAVDPAATTTAGVDKTRIWWDLRPSFGGVYTTASLMSLDERLRELGASDRVRRNIYAPFIIAGPSEFTDTWGAVRHDSGNKLRPHVGQDVFCDYGAPVLAAEPGTVEFTSDRLGGTVVRLHRADGGYWYYAHLSDYAHGLSSGDRVDTGDVIGHCGDSGNARGGTPHVHFGSYPGPENPMDDLVGWLEKAEQQAQQEVERLIDRQIPGPAVHIGSVVRVVAVERCPRPEPETADPVALIVPDLQ